MIYIDWSMLITKAMKEAAIEAERIRIESAVEVVWVGEELELIADQLLALEDDDPTALPGTEREWRDYRIKVRAWKTGNEDFPDMSKRPVRPS